MKTIGLLGGTAWPSTIDYYATINKEVHKRLGGFNSAKILLKSINYHEIMSSYGKDGDKICRLLKEEITGLLETKPDCYMICCNSLHKYYDIIASELETNIPMIHAVDITASYIKNKNLRKVILLAAKFTMEDGFFAEKISKQGVTVIIPNREEIENMHEIHMKFEVGGFQMKDKIYFSELTKKYNDCDAVILGCTEFPLLLDSFNSFLPIINPIILQVMKAVDFSLSAKKY
jgi:aspartate racemase